ncbi:MAG: 50S ribosomal protein L6 [Pirellulaceae bacterium]
MSRIGKIPVPILPGVKVALSGNQLSVEGPKGKLSQTIDPTINVEVNSDGNEVVVTRKTEERHARAMHGLTRALVKNMVEGVKDGYEKKLELVGVGYVCNIAGDKLNLRVGLANELKRVIPTGLTVTCPDQTHIHISGVDKQLVGQFAAEIRALRKPEPYKGKGIRYQGEHVKIKPGKAAKA